MNSMKRNRIINWRTIPFGLVFLVLCASAAQADWAIDATLGSRKPIPHRQFHLDFTSHIWYKFDQMVFLGIGSGVMKYGGEQEYPLLASTQIRLPIGGQVLPVVTGDWGYVLGNERYFMWRAGGGLDIKNGDRSSLLVQAGYQSAAPRWHSAVYLRAGLLLEF
jgi:hypothetical protein